MPRSFQIWCRRKQQQVENQLKELGMDSLQERLEDAAQTPANPPYRLATLIQVMRAILTEGPSCPSVLPLKHAATCGRGGSYGFTCTCT